MTTYACWAIIHGRVYLGPVEAKSEEEAIEIADYQLPMPALGSDVEFDIVDYEVVEG
jgi:hypothetical protein